MQNRRDIPYLLQRHHGRDIQLHPPMGEVADQGTCRFRFCIGYGDLNVHVRGQIIQDQRLLKHGVEVIGKHLKRALDDTRKTERGEFMQYFCKELNRSRVTDGLPPVTMGRMGKMLEKIPTKDLYYLKSICDKANNFSKKFWWEINPKKHGQESNDGKSQGKNSK